MCQSNARKDCSINTTSNNLGFYYLGSVILLALVIGGGTGQSLWTDHLIEIALLPAVFVGFNGLFSQRTTMFIRLFTLAAVCLIAWQFFPTGGYWPHHLADINSEMLFFSPVPGKSLESSLFFISLLGFGLYVAQLEQNLQLRLLQFIFIGLIVNIVMVLIQLSYSGRFTIEDVLPYDISVGIFANENHLSTLFFAIVPLLTFRFLVERHRAYIYYPALLIIITLLYGVGSRAGMFMSILIALVSIAWFKTPSVAVDKKLIFLLATFFVGVLVAWNVGGFDSYFAELRWEMAQNTWRAIKDDWLLGSGLGSFTIVYPMYEPAAQIQYTYANHAHNDLLEIILETGVPGMLLILALFWMLFKNFNNSLFTQACVLSIIIIAAHSLLDYPLRTMAIGIIFSYLISVVLSKPGTDQADSLSNQ